MGHHSEILPVWTCLSLVLSLCPDVLIFSVICLAAFVCGDCAVYIGLSTTIAPLAMSGHNVPVCRGFFMFKTGKDVGLRPVFIGF